MTESTQNPAEIAAAEAQARVQACLDAGQSFRLEAGAGAGKTYSLVEALKGLIAQRGRALLQAGQRVACITYTKVARDEIAQEIELHPAIVVDTIHSFCWGFMSQFQASLRPLIAAMPGHQEKIEEGGGVGAKRIEYSLGFFGVDEDAITLAHDDIPLLMAELLAQEKFRRVLMQMYPIIFVDEYQDTDKHFAAALSEHYLHGDRAPLIGLFGDHWQTIYRNDFALADFPIEGIDKGANFRSVPAVVNVLNALRPELPQHVRDPAAVGEARFFHTNDIVGERTNSGHSKEDLLPDQARQALAATRARLAGDGWNFDPKVTKILVLTHNALAAEQGYPSIAAAFTGRNDGFAKKEDKLIEFFADVVEPLSRTYADGCYGEMFSILGKAPSIKSHADKEAWSRDMASLDALRQNGSIGDVIDLLKETRRPRIPDSVMRREDEIARTGDTPDPDEQSSVTRHRALRGIPYAEVIELVSFLDGSTPFATQHSVKGAEFENVLVVLGGGWNHYNWPRLLELLDTGALDKKNEGGFHRARNLFYVALSRPKVRLAVLCTQRLDAAAMRTVERLFGGGNIRGLDI